MKRPVLIAVFSLAALTASMLIVAKRVWFETRAVTVRVDGTLARDAEVYRSGQGILVRLRREKPVDSYIIDLSHKAMGAAEYSRFTFLPYCSFSWDQPALYIPFGKLERQDPVFGQNDVSFKDWDGRLVLVRW